MATTPRPDTINPQSPDETPPNSNPIEQPVPGMPDATPPESNPGGGDTVYPGRGPQELPAAP